MSTMAENVIASEAENRPMLKKSRYDSWQSLEVLPTPNTPASTRERTLADLTPEEKIFAKEIWDRVKLLIEGSKLSLQERESKLYNEFDRFTSEKGETIHSYYLSFANKFVRNLKLAKDMHNVSFDQLYAYPRKHEVHANEVQMMRQRFPDTLALVANTYNSPPFYNNH
ncbi:hypothetical protein Tco_1357613 [Tanacetum coccineum]